MNLLKKIFVLVVIGMVLFPLVMFAGNPYYPFGTNGRFNVSATSGGKTLFFDNTGKLSLSGLDSNATVKLSVTAANGAGQNGLHIVGKDPATGLKKSFGPTAEVKVSDLQNSGFTARATEIAGESAELPINVDPTGMVNSKPLPFMSQQPDPPSTQYGNPNDPSQSTKSLSDKPGTGFVPCDGVNCTIEKILDMGANIYNYLVGMGALVAVGAIIMAGFSYIKSGGDPSEMKEAKKKVVYAITGLIILGVSVLLVNTVLKVFKSNIQTVESVGSSSK